MLNLLLMLAAAPAASMSPPTPMMRETRILPMPAEWHTLSQPHANSDDRMFPDIAVATMRIDGDTLYVQLVNKGGRARVPIQVVARAASNGMNSDEIQTRTPRLAAGESRWVALKGFSVRSASNSPPPVFDLASGSAVSAAAWLLPSTAGNLDRSGQSCGECSIDSDERNNILNLNGKTIARGSPFPHGP